MGHFNWIKKFNGKVFEAIYWTLPFKIPIYSNMMHICRDIQQLSKRLSQPLVLPKFYILLIPYHPARFMLNNTQ